MSPKIYSREGKQTSDWLPFTLAMEFDNVKKWAATNNFRLNPSKTGCNRPEYTPGRIIPGVKTA